MSATEATPACESCWSWGKEHRNCAQVHKARPAMTPVLFACLGSRRREDPALCNFGSLGSRLWSFEVTSHPGGGERGPVSRR